MNNNFNNNEKNPQGCPPLEGDKGEGNINHYHYNKRLKYNANKLRAHMTKAEACLWKYCLRAGMMEQYKFRRQRPIGWYIADFVCLELWLVIEVDGASHLFEETQAKDLEKERYLTEKGYRLLRFTDEEVLKNISMVTEQIKDVIIEQEKTLGKERSCGELPSP